MVALVVLTLLYGAIELPLKIITVVTFLSPVIAAIVHMGKAQ
jgi:hypothetical protein